MVPLRMRPPEKLEAAARHWAGPGRAVLTDTDRVALQADAAAFGIDPATLGGQETGTDDTLAVWPENWPILMTFLHLSTQWQWRREIPAMSGQLIWHGLPHTEIEATIRLLGHRREGRRIFEGVKIMEQAALPLLNAARP